MTQRRRAMVAGGRGGYLPHDIGVGAFGVAVRRGSAGGVFAEPPRDRGAHLILRLLVDEDVCSLQ